MYEKGIVRKVSDKTVTVSCGTEESCKGCKSIFCSKKDRIFSVRNPKKIEVEKGDEVEIYFSPGKTIFESFLVLIMPLLMFILFYFACDLIFDFKKEIYKVISGITGIAVGFISVFIYGKIRQNKDIPVLIKKV